MAVKALWLQFPATVLLIAKGDEHPVIPYVRRVPRRDYWRAVGGQAGYNRHRLAGLVAPVDHLRLDLECPHLFDVRLDWQGARYAVANPLVAIGLLWTLRETDWAERDVRALFVDSGDAERATAIAIRSLERLSGLVRGRG